MHTIDNREQTECIVFNQNFVRFMFWIKEAMWSFNDSIFIANKNENMNKYFHTGFLLNEFKTSSLLVAMHLSKV